MFRADKSRSLRYRRSVRVQKHSSVPILQRMYSQGREDCQGGVVVDGSIMPTQCFFERKLKKLARNQAVKRTPTDRGAGSGGRSGYRPSLFPASCASPSAVGCFSTSPGPSTPPKKCVSYSGMLTVLKNAFAVASAQWTASSFFLPPTSRRSPFLPRRS